MKSDTVNSAILWNNGAYDLAAKYSRCMVPRLISFLPRPLFNHNKVVGASDSPRWGASQSGFGHGHAIDTSSRTDPQRGRCEYEVESLLWQSTVAIKSVGIILLAAGQGGNIRG